MKLSTRDTRRLLIAARPAQHVGFSDSEAGRRLLTRIRTEPPAPARHRSKLIKPLAIAGIAAVVLAGTGTAIGLGSAGDAPPDWQPTNGRFMCATKGLQSQADVPSRPGESPADACRRNWSAAFGERAPRTLYACTPRINAQITPGVGPSVGSPGEILYVVSGEGYGSAAETCASVHMLVAPPGFAPASR